MEAVRVGLSGLVVKKGDNTTVEREAITTWMRETERER
jgi:hypothetical protein